MDKKYQVFISSTYLDMKSERQTAVEAILDAGHIPAGMELFSASDKKQIEVIKGWIDRSDIFMLVLGGRYGSVEPDSGKSYIQLEYEYAVDSGKPFFALYLTDSAIQEKARGPLGLSATEQNDSKKLNDFRTLVKSKLCSEVGDLKDIRIHVPKAIRDLSSAHKLEGWVRASSVPDITPLMTQLQLLQVENARLSAVQQSVQAGPPKLPSFSGNFSESALDLELTLEYSGEQSVGYSSFRRTWQGTYRDMFYMLGAKFLEDPADSVVRAYVTKVLKEQSPGVLSLRVAEQDYQKMKLKFAALGVIELRKINSTLCWVMTDAGRDLLVKAHAG